MGAMRDLHVPGVPPLPGRLLRQRFARSGGPGGQNVNKVETKADLRLDLSAAAKILGTDRVALVRQNLAGRLDAAGDLQVVCDEHRSRARNLEQALRRMEALLEAALARKRSRRPTRPGRRARERRLAQKQRRAALKRLRSRPADD